MRIEEHLSGVKLITIHDAPKLDPINVVLHDIGPRAGRLIIECYGEVWTAYWGGMGENTLEQFLTKCGPDYVCSKLFRADMKKREEAYLERIVQAVLKALSPNEED